MLSLPLKSEHGTLAAIEALLAGLTSVIAGQLQAVTPWTFYEELDTYLGPWGGEGYPIGYGKYYCVAFNQNTKLRDNATTREWVRQTTIDLQAPLRDFVVERFRTGTLPALTEPELRAFAFDTHPRAYTQAGLAQVVVVAPEMLPIIASIPAAEFDPGSPNFRASVHQVFATMALVLPEIPEAALDAPAPPYLRLFDRALPRERLAWARRRGLEGWREHAVQTLRSGAMDSLPLLTHLTDRLQRVATGSGGVAEAARQIIEAAEERTRYIAGYYREQVRLNPAMRAVFDREAPGWSDW